MNDEMLTSLREEADHSMEHQLAFVGAQDQNDVSGVQVFRDRLDAHPGPPFDRRGHAPADNVDRNWKPMIEDQPDALWMQVHARLVYGSAHEFQSQVFGETSRLHSKTPGSGFE